MASSAIEVLIRLQQVCSYEHVSYEESGLEAIIFTAEGDMRNALNALQSTVSGFGHVNAESVLKVCDQPHPVKLRKALDAINAGKTRQALDVILKLFASGYAASDIIQTLFKVTRSHEMAEPLKLDFIREIGFTHMRLAEGLNSQLQLFGCVSRMAALAVAAQTTNAHA
jgi:replication factor C subunit 2/4